MTSERNMTNHKRTYLWTHLRSRLQYISSHVGANYNWIFLPGGPGLGSESLADLTKILKLPGSIWHLDLPGDGSNVTENDKKYFAHWSDALVEAVKTLSNVILVAHSTGSMYALSTPKLGKILKGLVLMDSAPNAQWQNHFMEYVKNHPIQGVQKLLDAFSKAPSNALLKKITILSAEYSFTKKGLSKGLSLLKKLSYNYHPHAWSAEHFDQTYQAKWIPTSIPTLILAGEKDCITPLCFFENSKKFQKKNIMIRSIKNAGHFPWIENPKEVSAVFSLYSQKLIG